MVYTNELWKRATALSLAFAGVCFVLYPAILPLSDESTFRGAEAFSTSSWLLAHSLAMVWFILLTLGFLGLQSLLHEATAGSLGITALVVIWTGVSLVLPFYGAETFALRSVGRRLLDRTTLTCL